MPVLVVTYSLLETSSSRNINIVILQYLFCKYVINLFVYSSKRIYRTYYLSDLVYSSKVLVVDMLLL